MDKKQLEVIKKVTEDLLDMIKDYTFTNFYTPTSNYTIEAINAISEKDLKKVFQDYVRYAELGILED